MSTLFERVKTWLLKVPGREPERRRFSEPEIATAALLVEAAQMDGTFAASERAAILKMLARRFDLDAATAEALLGAAEARHGKADAVFKFALAARNGFNEEEREGLMEMLWTTILADGTVHDFEGNMMRRVAGLLHVTDRAAGEARKRAAEKLATAPGVRGDDA